MTFVTANNINYSKLHQELIDAEVNVVEFSNNAVGSSLFAESASIRLLLESEVDNALEVIYAYECGSFD